MGHKGGRNYSRGVKTSMNADISPRGASIDREIDMHMDSRDSADNSMQKRGVGGGQSVQYTTKERTQIMEFDRYMVQKKVQIEKLPDPMGRKLVANARGPIKVEKSAAEAHEEYLQLIQE